MIDNSNTLLFGFLATVYFVTTFTHINPCILYFLYESKMKDFEKNKNENERKISSAIDGF